MKLIAGIILGATTIELILLGFRFEIIFIIIARVLSLLKLIGLDIKFGWILGFEITTVAVYLTYTFLFRSPILMGNLLIMVGITGILLIVQAWDAYNYVYVEEDYYGEEED